MAALAPWMGSGPSAHRDDNCTCHDWWQILVEENASIWNCGVHLPVSTSSGAIHGASVEQISSKYSNCDGRASHGAWNFGWCCDGESYHIHCTYLYISCLHNCLWLEGFQPARPAIAWLYYNVLTVYVSDFTHNSVFSEDKDDRWKKCRIRLSSKTHEILLPPSHRVAI